MALPDELKTDTSSAPPPPKKPPVVDAGIFTPKPPDLPPNVRVSSPAQTISNRRIPDISDDELVAAFKDKPLYVLDRVNWNKTKSPYRRRLENLIAKDPSLQKILDYVLPVYPSATAQVQPQTVKVTEPPVVTAEKLKKIAVQPEAAPKKEITAENAPKIEAWMNGIKDHVYNSFAQSARRDVGTSQLFTQNLLSSLALYRGGLAGFYLSEGSKELIFSALGPIGDAFRSLYEKDVQRKMSWMKHPLNPDALNYYLTSLPNQMAFKIMYLPTKATFGILARGGAPLISQVHYQEFGQTKQSYVFTPLLRAAQFSNKLADGLDKLSGVVTDDFIKYRGEKSRHEQFIEGVNHQFASALKELKNAKAMGHSARIFGAKNKIKNLLNLHDGKFGQAIFRNGLKNLSRRLRRSSQDPVVGLFALITGTLIDISVGLVVNFARAIANRIINVIPGLNTLRAQMVEFLTSNRWLQTARIGGATGKAFIQGAFSATTGSSGYLGYRLGSSIFPHALINKIWIPFIGVVNLPFSINLAGGLVGIPFAGAGAFYTTALKMSYTQIPGWVREYDKFIAEGNLQAIEKGYLKGFKPGPFSRFASWLYKHPFARLPINGFVVGDILSGFMETRYGWNPWVSRLTFAAADYLWQIKGPLLEKLGTFISQIPWVKSLIASIQFGITFPLQGALHNLVWRATAFEQSLIGKMPVAWEMRAWAKFAKTFFNPGFLMGWQFFGAIFQSLGVPWYLTGPLGAVTGSITWNLAAYALERIFGTGIASMAKINAWGWTGYIIGSIIQMIWPALGPYFNLISAGLSIGIGMALSAANLSLLSLAQAALGWLGTAIPALAGATGAMAGWLAGWATALSIGLVAGLTIFAGFVIYSGFWVPMMAEWRAGPTSTNFSINTDVTQTGPNKYRLCAKFDVTQNVLNINNYLNLTMDFEDSQLTVNLSDPPKVTTASRDNTSLEYILDWIDPNLAPAHYGLGFPADDPPIVGGFQPMPTLPAHLSTPSNQQDSLYNLMLIPENQGLVNSIIPFLEILQEMAKDKLNPEGYTAYFVQGQEELQDLLNQQTTVLDYLQKTIAKAAKAGSVEAVLEKLNPAGAHLNTKLTDNPVKAPETISCSETNERCLEYKKTVKGYYDFYPNFINQKLGVVNGLIASANNSQLEFDQLVSELAKKAAVLEEEFSETEQMWENQKQLVKKLDEIKYQISKADSEILTDPKIKIRDFANLPEDTKQKLWEILTNYFGEIFNRTKYFYIPQGTNYTFCADTIYCADQPANCAPAQPQTVCSSIYALTNIWVGSAFAKSCTTFTPK